MHADMPRFSLLPLITSSDGWRLELVPAGGQQGVRPAFPFACTAQGPLSRHLPARLTVAGHSAFPLTLVLQSDEPAEQELGLSGASCRSIDALWQQAACWLAEHGRQAAFVPLAPEPYGPLAPVWTCTRTGAFFEPPCPHCGRQLALCRDGQVLAAAGLPSYDQGLQRFLFCPACLDQDRQPVFFAKQRRGELPPSVGDAAALVDGWSQMPAEQAADAGLACGRCAVRNECLPAGKAAARLAPVAFYPFFALAFSRLDMALDDFAALLAGKPLPETEERRLFLFDDPPRRAAEVLALKLTLMAELARHVQQAQAILGDRMAPWSLQAFAVRLPQVAGRLPALWQWELVLCDPLARPVPVPAFGEGAVAERLRFVAAAWLYILLVNGKQPAAAVMQAAETWVDQLASLPADQVAEKAVAQDPVFSPANLLWQPEPAAQELLAPWTTAVRAIMTLLHATLQPGDQHPADQAVATLDALAQDLRRRLLAAGPPPEKGTEAGVQSGRDSGHRELAAMVGRIADRWRQQVHASPEAVADEDGDELQTVVLGPGEHAARPATPEAAGPGAGAPPDMEKTVVLGQPPPAPGPTEDDLEATVALGARPEGGQPSAPAQGGPPAGPDPEATVVQAPDGRPPRRPDDELEATVVLPGKRKPPEDDHGR